MKEVAQVPIAICSFMAFACDSTISLYFSAAAVPVGTFGTIHYHLIGSPKVNDRYFLIPYQASIIFGFGEQVAL